MKRSALIIESSNVKGCEYLSGAVKDVENWHQFLRREIAGAWENDEIHVMHKPRAEVVVNFINQHKNDDYCMVIYTGHGAEVKKSRKSIPHVILNEKDCLVDVKYLTPKSSKGILISDACRSTIEQNSSFMTASSYGFVFGSAAVYPNVLFEIPSASTIRSFGDKFKDFENEFMDTAAWDWDSPTTQALLMFSPLSIIFKLAVSARQTVRTNTREEFQKKFFQKLSLYSNGVATIYSSSSGEASRDGSAGGAYLSALLYAIQKWKNSGCCGEVFTTYDAHKNAVDWLKRYNYAQNPEYSNPNVKFPIAIK